MKKSKKILLIILIVLIVITGIIFGARYAVIKILSNNQQVNDLVDKAANIVNDEKFQQEVDKVVQQMADDGMLSEEALGDYNQYVQSAKPVPVPAATPTPTKAPQGKTRTERILNAMSPADAAFARSMYGKINLGYAMELMNTDMTAAKEYIKSCLTSGEISKALEIYSKYAYLLSEIK